jgi:hypothetical protein
MEKDGTGAAVMFEKETLVWLIWKRRDGFRDVTDDRSKIWSLWCC